MASTGSSRLRLGFAGTPPFAATILRGLIEHHEVAVVYCQPPKPTGRGRKVRPSAVEALARESGFDVRTPRSLRREAANLEADRLDALIVAAYGLILPKAVLDTPRYGCINVHASLLPRWRGAAPIERAMMSGDRVTGISIMQMDEGLDTGPLLLQVDCPIRSDDTGDTLRDRLAVLGSEALSTSLQQLGAVSPKPQPPEGATYAAKLSPEESRIDWTGSAIDTALKIRALNSRQPAFCTLDGERIRLLFAEALDAPSAGPPGTVIAIDRRGLIVACADGVVRISRVALTRGQGKPMDMASFVNGYSDLIRPGQCFDASP
jgi:methionyl-tRNA formyltransferase